MRRLVIVLGVLFLVTASARAGLLVWTDARGRTHVTDDVKKIPEKYRDRAREASLQEPMVRSDYVPGTASPAAADEALTEYGGKPLLYWIQQINRMETDLIEARNTVTLLENEIRSLEHIKVGEVRRNPVAGKFYSRPVNPETGLYYVDENEKKQLEMKLEQVRHQADSLEEELRLFREEAKKAGVPPKYL